MTTIDWTDEYKAKVRTFMEGHGSPVQFAEPRFEWDKEDDVSVYGWTDYHKAKHIYPWFPGEEPCTWVVPEGAKLYERVYSQFEGTDADNLMEVGVNVSGCRCACGKLTDVTLRWTGSVTEMLHSILALPDLRVEIEL